MANILRLGLSSIFISSNVSVVDIVDLTAKARRFGVEEGSSFGAIGCGCDGGGGGAAAAAGSWIGADCKINCCCCCGAEPCVRMVYCVPPGDVHKVATC